MLKVLESLNLQTKFKKMEIPSSRINKQLIIEKMELLVVPDIPVIPQILMRQAGLVVMEVPLGLGAEKNNRY